MNILGFLFRHRSFSLAVGLLAVFGSVSLLLAAELRTWSDSSGKFKIEARLDSLQDGNVFLLRSDGTQIKIPLDKLSAADQEYAQQQAESASDENPSETPKEESPFQATEPSNTSASDEDFASASGSGTTRPKDTAKPSKLMLENRLVEPNWKSSDAVDISGEVVWRSIPSMTRYVSPSKPRPVSIPPRKDFQEKITATIIKPASGFVATGYNGGGRGPDETGYSRLVICEMKQKGRITNQATVPGDFVLLDVDDSGTLALVRRDGFRRGASSVAEIWSIGDKGVARGMQWQPFLSSNFHQYHEPDDANFGNRGFENRDASRRGGAGTRGFDERDGGSLGFNNETTEKTVSITDEARDIAWGRFLGDNRALIGSELGGVSLWDLTTCRVLWHMDVLRIRKPGLSPDQRYLAFCTHNLIGIVDIQKGKLVSAISPPPHDFSGMNAAFAFSPSMKRFAATTGSHLFVWNLQNGELLRTMPYVGRSSVIEDSLGWVDDVYVLVGGGCLIDAANSIQLWRFDGGSGTVIDDYVWFQCGMDENSRSFMGFVPVKLPHAEMMASLKQAMQNPDLYALKPGTVVRLDVSGIKTNQEEVRQILTKKLEDAGFRAGPEGTIDLVASHELGEREKRFYSQRSILHGEMEFDVQNYISELKLVYQGNELWRRMDHSIPSSLSVKKDESFEQIIRKSEHFTNRLFEGTKLPNKLMKTTDGVTLGVSRITPNGIQ